MRIKLLTWGGVITDIYEYIGRFGDYRKDFHSYGLYCLTTKAKLHTDSVALQNMSDGKSLLRDIHTGKWCIIDDTYHSDHVRTMMLGAVCGNIIGSFYQNNPNKYYPEQTELLRHDSRFSAPTVLTCAIALGIDDALFQLADKTTTLFEYNSIFRHCIVKQVVSLGEKYRHVNYKRNFWQWLFSSSHTPYCGSDNDSAIRVSYAGWVAKSLEEAERLAKFTAEITHNHYEGVKGAKVVAGCIYILRSGGTKQDIVNYVKWYYNINFTLEQIRPQYQFSTLCQDCVPVAVVAFLEGKNFADVIARAVSLGGDSESLAAIAGSIAETIYPIPYAFREIILSKTDTCLRNILIDVIDFCVRLYGGEQ